MSERRHRLYKHEIPEVIKGLKLRLEQLLEVKEDRANARIAFHTLFRLTRRSPGRPKYPEFSWDYLSHYLTSNESDKE